MNTKLKDNEFTIRNQNMTPSKNILLKICYIDSSLSTEREKEYRVGNKLCVLVSENAFTREVNTQKDVFRKSNQNYKPITPVIYFYDKYNGKRAIETIDKLIDISSGEEKIRFRNIKQFVGKQNSFMIGLIYMEMREGYITIEKAWNSDMIKKQIVYPSSCSRHHGKNLDHYDNSHILKKVIWETNIKYFTAMIGEVLNRLHSVCKYTHGDLHENNILINITSISSYSPYPGNILLIDWGRAQVFNAGYSQLDPYKEAETERNATVDPDFWSYRWLETPKYYAKHPRGYYGMCWNNENVKIICDKLRKIRESGKSDFKNNLEIKYKKNIPIYVYQPGDTPNILGKTKRSQKKSKRTTRKSKKNVFSRFFSKIF